MTRQFPTKGLELEHREYRARFRVFLALLIPGAVLTAIGIAIVSVLAAWVLFFGGAL